MISPVRIISQPGIKRDGTLLEGDYYVDGQWCRWSRGLPRKMQGYRKVAAIATEKTYGMTAFGSNAQEYVHTGSQSKLLQYTLDYNATYLTQSDRTPGAGFVANANNLWQFAILYDSVGTSNRLIAHPGQNLASIDSTATTNVFYGDITGTAALIDTAVAAVSGGIIAIAPYLFKFGNDGQVDWSVANKPADFTNVGSGTARITGAKIVKGLPLRGNGAGPAALFWSLDSLCRASFTGGAGTWAFDTISAETSILSSQCAVEYDGIYYWAGVDRFLMFNGVVREIPNQMNLDWFYENLNYAQRQKVFAYKVPRWGEIWWCYPRGSAAECTHAVIFNIRENSWYDTPLPGSGRSAGAFATVYEHPFMMGVDLTSDSKYRLWKHEEANFDEIDGATVNPINSFFETNEIKMLDGQQPSDKSLRVARMEPDFVQSGDMTLSVRGRANARATEITSDDSTFPDDSVAIPSDEQTIPLKEVRRLMRFRFGSNTPGGDYRMGECYAHIEPADGRIND